MRTTTTENRLARFEEKYQPDPNSGCWIWLGAMDVKGYPLVKGEGKVKYAYRLAYLMFKGKVRKGYDVHHTCHTPLCVNPDHLQALTRRAHTALGENIVGRNIRKTHCERGHPFRGENLRVDSKGKRGCKTCDRERMREVRRMWKENHPDRRLPSAQRTHCPKGHEYSGENVYVRANGWRQCRACDSIYQNEKYRKNKLNKEA